MSSNLPIFKEIWPNMIYTGNGFTNRYNKSNTKFYKILRKDLVHNGYKFVNGLNIDPVEFNPNGECSQGGFYFTEYDKIGHWLEYIHDLTYIVEVTIPDDAKVCVKENKFKTDKIILDLNNKKLIQYHKCWSDIEFCKKAVKQNYNALNIIKHRCESIKDIKDIKNEQLNDVDFWSNIELCKLAVQRCGCDLQFVNIPQTDELCKLAIQQNGSALEYVTNQTEALCKLAIQENGYELRHVINQTEDICKLAVQKHGYALEYVNISQTEDMCKLAVQQSGCALKYVINQTDEICKLAVEQNAYALHYVNISTNNISWTLPQFFLNVLCCVY